MLIFFIIIIFISLLNKLMVTELHFKNPTE